MKKIFLSLLLTSIVCISLCACGKKISREELLEKAEIIENIQEIQEWKKIDTDANCNGWSVRALQELKYKNEAKFNETYIGNIYIISGLACDIKDNYCMIGYGGYSDLAKGITINNDGHIKVYLSSDELVDLSWGDEITVVGQFEKTDDEECTVCITNAFLMNDT